MADGRAPAGFGDQNGGNRKGGTVSESEGTRVRLLFVDDGTYHHEEVRIPSGVLDRYDRLIDCLLEEPEVLRHVYVDLNRLCAAHRVEEE